jgi:hypothetical protein
VNPLQYAITRPQTLDAPVRLRLFALGVAAFVLAAVTIVAIAFAMRGAAAPTTSRQAVEVTDGWMHGTSAFGTISHSSAGEVTDGWAVRYLPSRSSEQATDGWATRYLPSGRGD